jgi:hypothetical protein
MGDITPAEDLVFPVAPVLRNVVPQRTLNPVNPLLGSFGLTVLARNILCHIPLLKAVRNRLCSSSLCSQVLIGFGI